MKKLWMLLGPSGSGKSTVAKKIVLSNSDNKTVVYSWDTLRLEWYDENYSRAWIASINDKQFVNKSMLEFNRLLGLGVDIIIDNVNLTPKSREKFIMFAKQQDYQTTGVIFDVPLQTLINRQLTRSDKMIPTHAVTQQFNSFVLPTDGEFDIILQAKDII